MFVSVHYVDNVRNVKTNRGGITGHIILPIPLPSMQSYYAQILLYFYALLCNVHQFYIICVFYCTYCNCILLHANK